jgi:hypothetical protein
MYLRISDLKPVIAVLILNSNRWKICDNYYFIYKLILLLR